MTSTKKHNTELTKEDIISTYKTLPRKKTKLNAPDEFMTSIGKIWIWLSIHRKHVYFVLAIAAAVGLLWYGAGSLNRYLENKANSAFYKALVLPNGSSEQIAALENVADKYSRKSAGRRAMLALGRYYLDKDPGKSRIHFQNLLGVANERPLLEVVALHGIASTYENQKMWDEAASAYLKAAALPGNLIANKSRFDAALAYEQNGKQEEAIKLYNVISEDESSPEANKAKERILWLAIK